MELTAINNIENRIFLLRGCQVMLDFHLAELYDVETKRLNEQVKRNSIRFPESFMFHLTKQEWEILRSQFATSEINNDFQVLNGNQNPFDSLQSQFATTKRRTLPFAFTEQGVAMLSAVLRSETAIKVSIQIIQAFVQFRQLIFRNALLVERVGNIELKQLETEKKIEQIFRAIENKKPEPEKGIFFDGQVFDAYAFVAGLIKNAQHKIVLIDNYVDESVLSLLSKRNENAEALIYTKTIDKTLKLDLQKHNAQYPPITVKTFPYSHDRFLMIDHKELYHIGASLKDLGKKPVVSEVEPWFAFSRMDSMINELLSKLNPNKNK